MRSLLRVEVAATRGSDASVYSFAIFTTDFCDRFVEELDNYYSTGLPQPRSAPPFEPHRALPRHLTWPL